MTDDTNYRLERIEHHLRWQWLAIAIMAVLLSVFAVKAVGQDLPTPSQALDWALADQLSLPEADRQWQRYLWIPPWGFTDSWAAAGSFSINTAASQASIIVQPRVIANGWMIAVDLRRIAPRLEQLTHLVSVWGGLATKDPHFHEFQEVDQKIVAVLAGHLKRDNAVMLSKLNNSPVLVYRLDWFLTRLLDTEYYDFMGYPKTFDEVMASIGVNQKLSESLGGDQRVGMFGSDVAGLKPRKVTRIQGVGGRFNTGAVFYTGDIFDETVELKRHVIYNLLESAVDGGETIFERANGMQGYLLQNGAGALVRVAPPNLVSDHTIPAPYTRQLRPAISCIRCHFPSEGWQTVRNDVRTLILSGAIDVVDDFGNVTKSREENIERLAGLYAGDFTRRIQLARDDLSLAVRRATEQPTRRQGWTVPQIGAVTSAIYGSYVYQQVDAAQACRELGYSPGEDPLETVRRVLPDLPPDPEIGLRFADPTVAAVKAGIPVSRTDWDRVIGPALLASQTQERENAESN